MFLHELQKHTKCTIMIILTIMNGYIHLFVATLEQSICTLYRKDELFEPIFWGGPLSIKSLVDRSVEAQLPYEQEK